MLPLTIPAGTTVESLFERVLPETHRSQVSALPGATSEYLLGVHVAGAKDYLFRLSGREVSFREERGPAHLHMAMDAGTVERFLLDWMGERRFLPTFVPNEGVTLLTDPRVLKRLTMVTGSIELALPDFEGGRAKIVLSANGGRKHERTDSAKPDVVVELGVPTFESLLAAKLGPDDALTDGHVSVTGKRLVAMQFAFALVPFFPKMGDRGDSR